MRRALVLAGVLMMLVTTGAYAHRMMKIKLTSTAFKYGGTIKNDYVFSGFGCSGKNTSPELRWYRVPKGTKSLALTAYDPDAPTGSGWWHWVVYNIPPAVKEFPAGAGSADGKGLPVGAVQGNTDFGSPGYGGPCPPKGDRPHHYIFTVYALKTDKLVVPKNASPALIGYFIHANMIGKGVLVGRYGRKK